MFPYLPLKIEDDKQNEGDTVSRGQNASVDLLCCNLKSDVGAQDRDLLVETFADPNVRVTVAWDSPAEHKYMKANHPSFEPVSELKLKDLDAIWGKLQCTSAIQFVVDQVVSSINFTEPQLEAEIVGVANRSISRQRSYDHPSYGFHTDVSPNPEVYARQIKRSLPYQFQSTLADPAYALFPVTFVAYFMDDHSAVHWHPAFATTVVKCNENESDLASCRVGYCPRKNGTVGIFPGWNEHSVAPNPGLERFGVVRKVNIHYKRTAFGESLDWQFFKDKFKTSVNQCDQFTGIVSEEVGYLSHILQESKQQPPPQLLKKH